MISLSIPSRATVSHFSAGDARVEFSPLPRFPGRSYSWLAGGLPLSLPALARALFCCRGPSRAAAAYCFAAVAFSLAERVDHV